MSKLVSKCCVCGKVYGVTTTDDGSDRERFSHGYCGSGCAAFTIVQIMFFDKSIDCFNLEEGQEVGGIYYFHGQEIRRFILRTGDEAIVINYIDTAYNEEVVVHTKDTAHMHRVVKEEVKKWDMPAVLL